MRPALSTQTIVDAAFDLVDEKGPSGLSMRALAARLGVGAMALYRYFPSKDALLDAVVAAGCERVVLRVERDGDWRQRIESLFLSVHHGLVRHPNLGPLLSRSRSLRPGTLKVAEVAVDALTRAGFSEGEAAQIYRALLAYTIGRVTQAPVAQTDEQLREGLAQLVILSPAEFPVLSNAGADFVAERDPPEEFEFGLALFLDGLQARLPGRTAAGI
jgi:AcrR family transcriptional regulator